MKLEVGQKIGIYEVTKENWNPKVKTGNYYLGIAYKYDVDIMLNSVSTETMFDNEVRKVGSLIVKRLKL